MDCLAGTWCDGQRVTWVFGAVGVRFGMDHGSLGNPILIRRIVSEPEMTLAANLGDDKFTCGSDIAPIAQAEVAI